MRAMATAGPALERDNAAGYNCAFLTVSDPRAFDEALYLLSCGSGVGFSVEHQYISRLPVVPRRLSRGPTVRVRDSKCGWAESLRFVVTSLYQGEIPQWDLSGIRPRGARLVTFGGRASGPGPLDETLRFTVETLTAAAGRRLYDIECHDIMCKIAACIVSGGVRRSAQISLSDLHSERMRDAKTGDWWKTHPHRALANNSAVFEGTPSREAFDAEWAAMIKSYAGERGIFNRQAARDLAPARRDASRIVGTNPCAEISLRDMQMCNLSEAIVRPEDTEESLRRKISQATMLGTVQSTLVDFRYLRPEWRENCAEERLLGVSLTGVMDHPVLGRGSSGQVLQNLRDEAVRTNREWAGRLGIPQSASVTCVKPSGTVSQLVDCASGLHPRYARHYIRRTRGADTDPLSQLMIDQHVPHELDQRTSRDWVFEFPMAAPESAVTAGEMTCIEQLELWKKFQSHWCEHKPSMTAYYRPSEIDAVADWVYENFSIISGVSFLPYDDHIYVQAPYEPIDQDTYDRRVSEMPAIDWSRLSEYEHEDQTTTSQELACVGGACEIV